MSELDSIFDSVIEDGGDAGSEDFTLPKNATIHMGDGEVISDDVDDDAALDLGDDEPEVSDETEDTDVDDELDSEEAATEDEFDFESVKDKSVTVTVNGETFEVPLAELRNGYMRQADYTRKTQQIAADTEVIRWAKTLQEGFQTDPNGVISYLAEQFGLQVVAPSDPWQELVQEDPSLTPLVETVRQQAAELADLRRQSQATAQDREAAAVRAELNEVQSKYPDFDPQQVIPVALQNGVRLEQAYKIWKADQVVSAQAEQETARQKAEEAAARREKARAAKKAVTQGASKAKAADGDEYKKFDSFEELFTYEMSNR